MPVTTLLEKISINFYFIVIKSKYFFKGSMMINKNIIVFFNQGIEIVYSALSP